MSDIRAATLVADDDGAGGREGLTEKRARGNSGVLRGIRPAPRAAADLQARVEPGRWAHGGASACKGGEGDLASTGAGELGGAQPVRTAARATGGRAIAQRGGHVGAKRAADDTQHHAPTVVAVDPFSSQVHGEIGVRSEQGGDHRPGGGDGGVAGRFVSVGLAEERVADGLEDEAGSDVHAHRN